MLQVLIVKDFNPQGQELLEVEHATNLSFGTKQNTIQVFMETGQSLTIQTLEDTKMSYNKHKGHIFSFFPLVS